MTIKFVAAVVILLGAFLCISVFHRSTWVSMLSFSLAGILVYLLLDGFTPDAGNQVVSMLGNLAETKYPVIISIFLLLFLVFLLSNSEVRLESAIGKRALTPAKAILIMMGVSVPTAVDDYLLCCSVGSLAPIAAKAGISVIDTTILANVFAVCFCSCIPFSSWAVVIREEIGSNISMFRYMKILMYNFPAMLGIILVVLYATGRAKQKADRPKRWGRKAYRGDRSYTDAVLFFSILILLVTGTIVLTVLEVNNALIKSSACVDVCAILLLFAAHRICPKQVRMAIHEAGKATLELALLLGSVWMLAETANTLLGFGKMISSLAGMNFPVELLPLLFFTIAAIASLLMASSYSIFGLLIPIGVQIGAGDQVQAAVLGAIIGGSLFAFASRASDTLSLSAKTTDCKCETVYRKQQAFAVKLFAAGVMAYAALGICMKMGTLWLIPLALTAIAAVAVDLRFIRLFLRKMELTLADRYRYHEAPPRPVFLRYERKEAVIDCLKPGEGRLAEVDSLRPHYVRRFHRRLSQ